MIYTGPTSLPDENLERFWNLESLGIQPSELTSDTPDALYRNRYQNNCIKLLDGRFQASLPWEHDFPELPTNYSICSTITRNMIRR